MLDAARARDYSRKAFAMRLIPSSPLPLSPGSLGESDVSKSVTDLIDLCDAVQILGQPKHSKGANEHSQAHRKITLLEAPLRHAVDADTCGQVGQRDATPEAR
jgi:hypothetical protein